VSNFCPEWIFGVCSAQTGKDFLSSNNSINSISKKFSEGLSDKYSQIKFEEILDSSEQILQFLSEINAGEEAINYINDYIHFRVNFESSGSIRKLSGLFSSSFDGNKVKEYNTQDTLKVFKATIFSIRNNALPKSTPGWVITDKEDIDWLGELFEKEVDITNF
jgi:hypothetical protein